MPVAKIDLPALAAFVAACDCASLSKAAERLGISPPAITARLKSLEADLNLTLFERYGRQSLPLPSAAWLYDLSVRLLAAEEFLCIAATREPGELRTVVVKLDAAYSGTFLARAVLAAIRDVHRATSGCFIDLILTSTSSVASEKFRLPLLAASTATLTMSTVFPRENVRQDELVMLEDEWVVLAHSSERQAGASLRRGKLVIPELPEKLGEDATFHLNKIRLVHEVVTVPVSLQDSIGVRRLLAEGPLLLPRTLLPQGSSDAVSPFADMPSAVAIRQSGSDPVIARLLERLRARLSEKPSALEVLPSFDPRVTMKQVKIMNLAISSGSMAGAARAVDLSPPAAATQISQLESALANPVMIKDHNGSRPTRLASNIYPICLGMQGVFEEILGASSKIAARFQQSIRIGLPPSWSSDSLTTVCVGAALAEFHRVYPSCGIEVVEGPRDALNAGVRRGQLNIAVVGRAGHNVGRLPIGYSEDLFLIVNRGAAFQPESRHVSIDDLKHIPLILAPDQLTMHQTFLSELAKGAVYLTPIMRLGSIPLIVSVIRKAPFGTILPASVVRRELEDGILSAFPLNHIMPRRRLWAIFSTDHPLSEIERHLVMRIKTAVLAANAAKT